MPSNEVSVWHKRIRIVALLVIAMSLVAAGVLYYQLQVAPFRKTVLTVDSTSIRMDYFLKRIKMAGSEPAIVLEQLTYEQIVKMMAPIYGISVSQSEVDETLLGMATYSDDSVTKNDAEVITQTADRAFKEWYQQQIKTTGLSDAEYQELIRANLVAARFQTYLSDNVPTRSEQVYLHVIVLGTSDDAIKAKARINAGEAFTTVAYEVSLDDTTRVDGGDIGWIPRGIIPYDDIVFQLDVDRVSDPVLLNVNASGDRQYAIFMVSEKDLDRQIEDTTIQLLKSMALYNWLRKEIPNHTVNYNFDEETQDWVNLQLADVSD